MSLSRKINHLIKELKDDELACYVCRKKIIKLASLRKAYNNKKKDLDSDKVIALREYVARKVVFVEIHPDKKKIFRHSACNPRDYKPTVEDL